MVIDLFNIVLVFISVFIVTIIIKKLEVAYIKSSYYIKYQANYHKKEKHYEYIRMIINIDMNKVRILIHDYVANVIKELSRNILRAKKTIALE